MLRISRHPPFLTVLAWQNRLIRIERLTNPRDKRFRKLCILGNRWLLKIVKLGLNAFRGNLKINKKFGTPSANSFDFLFAIFLILLPMLRAKFKNQSFSLFFLIIQIARIYSELVLARSYYLRLGLIVNG